MLAHAEASWLAKGTMAPPDPGKLLNATNFAVQQSHFSDQATSWYPYKVQTGRSTKCKANCWLFKFTPIEQKCPHWVVS